MEEYESIDEAFPDFDESDFETVKTRLSRCAYSDGIFSVMQTLQGINEWSKRIQSKYKGHIINEIGGVQSFAGRMVPMLDELFGTLEVMSDDLPKDNVLRLTSGLDFTLEAEVEKAMLFLKRQYKIKEKYTKFCRSSIPSVQVDDFTDFFELDLSGSLILTGDKMNVSLRDIFFRTKGIGALSGALRNATEGIKLMKRSMRAFQNEWGNCSRINNSTWSQSI